VIRIFLEKEGKKGVVSNPRISAEIETKKKTRKRGVGGVILILSFTRKEGKGKRGKEFAEAGSRV